MTIEIDENTLPLSELMGLLEQAVRDSDRTKATQLERAILKRLVHEAREREDTERRTRELMAQLVAPTPEGSEFSLDAELSSTHQTKAIIYPVWFCTNRRPNGDGGFTSSRHDTVTRGKVEVVVPAAHRFGETGSSLWTRLCRFDWRDDHLKVERIESQDWQTFFDSIKSNMASVRDNKEAPHALIYIHGYNVTFEDAAIRAAQLGCDLKVPGATAFFSWPSRGSVQAYPVDEASIEGSEAAITDFLVDFAANCGAEKVHLIAHSMGNRGLLRALQRIASNAETHGKVKFDQIFLAAPDVDRDLFVDLARVYTDHSVRTTLYASDGDLAVHFSSKIHNAPRAGYFTPYTVATGIDTIAVPFFDVDWLGHSYYAQAEALLYDIRDLMCHNNDPGGRQRVEPASVSGVNFWTLKR
jgi:esterase/lipase superfamily enzyme